MTFLVYFMVYAGSALMAFNVLQYLRFAGNVKKDKIWVWGNFALYLPITLLALFLAGYLAVAFFGKPDVVVAGILFGGSIFVFVMLWLMRRVVDRIREHAKLEARLAAAEDASRAKTFFLSNMSHDLRTPLNAVIGYTALAKKEDSPENIHSYVDKIEKAGRQLLGIVNNVLEMSRIESGKLELAPVRTDLGECVDSMDVLFRDQLEEKGIRFDCVCEATHRIVQCDHTLLDRVLSNLLSNAAKFTEAGGSVLLSLRETAFEGSRASYEIRVKDTGIGMSREFAEKLFIPFERERASTVSKIQGTGLGMAITKNIVELMGGAIEVTTEKGKGTEFLIRVSFPVESSEEENGGETDGETRFDGYTILLVEDNEVNTEIAQL
ncbi:MAG: hypothetical protein II776_00255, partial [Clostridia bacterium]|nr:hypothetical protein [Clostridia bacterium]